MAKFWFLLFFSVAVGFFVMGSTAHDEHIVGGRDGWTIPPNATFYQDWAKTQNFKVGDRLVFPYTIEMYTVVEASKEDFDNCTQRDIKARYYAPPTVLELLEPGPHYYYCGVGLHCEAGQKLSIVVCDRPNRRRV
ncbi:umecyanin-like [Ananas comosus]|uniref:Umecyanin n=1 Tax=Ananas comosus TaxID=4615 RepID=A0A199UZI5_ANACO|nr:umecyanin-like [Ananas comosus]OAY70060.1 Umecyanin [Ananas comosus]